MGEPTKPADYEGRLRAAVAALQKQQARITELEEGFARSTEPIAIVGMACRFPAAADLDAFWRMLSTGVDAIREVPADRWAVDETYDADPDQPGKTYTRFGGFLDAVDRFDARFFQISPREALTMDPQQRLLLEVTWEALEHAGIPPDSLSGSRSGVFVGLTMIDYARVVYRQDYSRIDTYTATGNVPNIASGRLSYFFGLRGPSLTLDTACSSSLVTIHLACQSLRSGECDLALAAGVNLMLTPDNGIAIARAKMLAPDGRCKAFDAEADGYARSEGCGVVALKRLSAAIADEDRIVAIIRGSAVRQDGARSGLTVPNGPAQQAVIRAALECARVAPGDVGYVEAHGTGTRLGDPIEIEALGAVYGQGRPPTRPLMIGALKTNVGHMEAAAGVGGVIKTALVLGRGHIPPVLHLTRLNPEISLDEIPARIPVEPAVWPGEYARRIAGVSSFGSSGTIAHVIIEAPPSGVSPRNHDRAAPMSRPEDHLQQPGEAVINQLTLPRLLPLSAKTDAALEDLVRRYEEFLGADGSERFADICFTAGTGRAHFRRRAAVVARNGADAAEQLRDRHIARLGPAVRGEWQAVRPAVFLFTGQGALASGAGRELYEHAPAFRRTVDRAAAIVAPDFPRPLPELLFDEDAEPLLRRTDLAQVALFALQAALVELWRSWGIAPAAVAGHSVGEYAAAYTAGVLSLEDALQLLAIRGRLMQETAVGTMAAAFASAAVCGPLVRRFADRVSIAAVNAPAETIISGDSASMDEILEEIEAKGIATKRLRVDRAFHSPLMAPIVGRFRSAAARLEYRASRIKLLADLTGEWVAGEGAGPDYWVRHLTEPVLFHRCLETLRAGEFSLFVEIGPAAVLTGLGRAVWGDQAGAWVPSLRHGGDALEQMLEAAGTCYVNGHDVDWREVNSGFHCRRVTVPTYPFQRERYWPDSEPAASRTDTASEAERSVARSAVGHDRGQRDDRLRFGVMFFNGTETSTDEGGDRYRFVLDASRFADRHGLSSVWLPERHFTDFGGLYPNPATLHAALARETTRVRLMAGSVVMPLHSPFRVAEEWAVVDNLSGGRVGISFASGWNPDDFALSPEAYRDRHDRLFRGIDEVRRLWRGEFVTAGSGSGREVSVRTYPTPVQPELPVWVTAASNPATFERAGAIGANVLTHLLDHDVAELAEKIARYRTARARNGFDPASGEVTLMLHTFVGEDADRVREQLRAPYCRYIKQNIHLLKGLAFSRGNQIDLEALSAEDLDAFVGFLYERFFYTRGLLGTPESCLDLVRQVREIGVTEIACLLDFAPAVDEALASLPHLVRLVERVREEDGGDVLAVAGASEDAPYETDSDPSPARAASPLDDEEWKRWLYELTWQPIDVAPRSLTAGAPAGWQVFMDRGGVGDALVRKLEAAGQSVLRVYQADEVGPSHERAIGLQVDDDPGWEGIADRACRPLGDHCAPIIYLWHLDRRPSPSRLRSASAWRAGAQGAEAAENGLGLLPIVRLVKALTARAAGREVPRIWFVSRGAHEAPRRSAAIEPHQAALWGFVKVIPIEQPRLWGGIVDLDPNQEAAIAAHHLLGAVLNESREDQVAFSDGRAFGARLSAVPSRAIEPRTWSCRADAAYLVTGGFRGLGLEAASWLVRKGARHVVLVGRTVLASTDAAAHALEAAGASVEIVAIDVADEDAIAAWYGRHLAAGRPRVAGILHAAGVWRDCPLAELDAAALDAVLGPKVGGLATLETCFGDERLDFFVTFSAFSSLLPAETQANYAAANAYMDAAIRARRQRGQTGLAVNWGPWSEVGFAETDYGRRAHARLEALGITSLKPVVGFELLDRIIGTARPQTGVMPVDWRRLFQTDPNAKLSPFLAELVREFDRGGPAAEHTAGRLLRLVSSLAPNGQLDCVERELTDMVAAIVRIARRQVERDLPFTEFGLDSLMAVELKNRIQHEAGVNVPLVRLLEGPSVATLAMMVLAGIKAGALGLPETRAGAEDLNEIEV